MSELANLLFPPSCLLCLAPLLSSQPPELCAACQQRITPLANPIPIPCGLLYTSGTYAGALADLVQRLKFAKDLRIVATLAHLMATALVATGKPPKDYDRLIPVPLHRTDLARRGFNQAATLATAIARSLKVPCDHRGLKKIKRTAAQHYLSRTERAKNLATAFLCRCSYHGETCLVIDDVYTTGATTAACAEALADRGALRVDVLTAARTV